MFSKYAKQGPQLGKTVPYALLGLRNPDGSHPIVHLEHLGEGNRPFWLEMLAAAQAELPPPTKSPAELDKRRRDTRAENREIVIRHSARRLENVIKDDGTVATDADLPLFIRAIPDADFDDMLAFAKRDAPYREYAIAESPKALAEK